MNLLIQISKYSKDVAIEKWAFLKTDSCEVVKLEKNGAY